MAPTPKGRKRKHVDNNDKQSSSAIKSPYFSSPDVKLTGQGESVKSAP